ncbi:hypothetical protein QC764_509820 [Podospora pseudoanserina]|uniref:Glucose-methanol-choline oxidoreductase N-terminal domain-containing protein n=1 Tax=Podospora pseudoanserina TaxID=2609844 RepID=A0ABR0I7P7_9PEZI|nr:hypothetical protein QC764_509820 [Podospora pseudoanserina]
MGEHLLLGFTYRVGEMPTPRLRSMSDLERWRWRGNVTLKRMATDEIYDFIIVGGGPAGSALAYGLSQCPKPPKVLILEAGGDNEDKNLRVDGQRWLTFTKEGMNWGYKTTPQEFCNNREIDYSRGKGLGGSTAINFGVFTVGAKDDYDTWAEMTGDDDFAWDKINDRFKRIVTVHPEVPPGTDKKYASLTQNGSNGPVHVGYAAEFEEDLLPLLEQFEQGGFPLNSDHNSGNPLGMSVLISSAYRGLRSTSKDLLANLPPSFTVLTNSPVQRVIFDSNKKAAGVESNSRVFHAKNEVLLSAGALDSPRVLMHSGVGPADQLSQFNIPIIADIPSVGQNLRDHCFVPLVYKRSPNSITPLSSRSAFWSDQTQMDVALEQWKTNPGATPVNPWGKYACELGIGFFKLDSITSSKEFLSLPEQEKKYLNKETIPHYEVITHFPMHWFLPGFPANQGTNTLIDYTCFLVFLYNAQTLGTVRLQSSDPAVPLLFDPRFLAHEFDRKAAVEALREIVKFTESENFKQGVDVDGIIAGPKGKDAGDEELLEYWKENISSSWHMTGTCKMGEVVDADFKVKGVEGVRVVDMSAVPVLVSGHTQAVAYVTGYTAAEKILREYGL